MNARILTTIEVDGRGALSAVENVAFDGPYDKDFDVPAGATVKYPLMIELALTEALILVAGEHLQLKLGNVVLERKAGEPLIWTRGSGLPCPLKADTSQIEITSLSKTDGKLFVRVMELQKPPEAPQAVAVEAPPVLPAATELELQPAA